MPESKRAIIIRGGRGIGDLIFCTPLPRLLALEGYETDAAVWPKNKAVFQHNPYVGKLVSYPKELADRPWQEWGEQLEKDYDLVVTLAFSVEKEFLHKTDGQFGEIPPLTERREKARGINYYDFTVERAGFSRDPGEHFRGELYLSPGEQETLAEMTAEKESRGEKIVLWNLNGSTRNKQVVQGFRYLDAVLRAVPNSRHYIVSDQAFASSAIPADERVVHVGGQWNLRTSLAMTSVADLVVGPESALVNAAGCFATPKIVLYSHSAPENLGGNWDNHFPVRPACDCSPCYLIPVDFRQQYHPAGRALARAFELECRHPHPEDPYRAAGYHCTCTLPGPEIVDTAIKVLQRNGKRKRKKG